MFVSYYPLVTLVVDVVFQQGDKLCSRDDPVEPDFIHWFHWVRFDVIVALFDQVGVVSATETNCPINFSADNEK